MSVCGNAVALRGHIAAWHKAHILAGKKWPHLDQSLFDAVYKGTVSLQAPRSPRPGVRLPLLEAILEVAVGADNFMFAAACALAYTFVLRVPSELLRQFRVSNTKAARDWGAAVGLAPGERLIRKNRPGGTVLARPCTCKLSGRMAKLCPHLWLLFLRERAVADQLFEGYTYAQFVRDLRIALRAVAESRSHLAEVVGDPEAWASHAFRTGAGRDLLASGGIRVAQEAGQWDSLRGLSTYTTADGVTSRRLAELLIEADEEIDS